MLKDFKPIKGITGHYEINSEGVLRNVRTKHVRQPYKNGQAYYFNLNGRTLSQNKLLKQIHGIEPDYRFSQKVGVRISTSGETHYFKTSAACADFLAPKVYYSENTIRKYLARRAWKIGSWTIAYEVDENGNV